MKRTATSVRSRKILARVGGDVGWRASSEDGLLAFHVVRTTEGVHLERTRVRRNGSRNVLSVLFIDERELAHWCDNDELRFEYLHLCGLAKRMSLELLEQPLVNADAQSRLRF